jgi:hypothetical protein
MNKARSRFSFNRRRPLFAILASLKGLKPEDRVRQSSPWSAKVEIDVTSAGNNPVRLDHDGSTLDITAQRWGAEDLLRRIHLGELVRPVSHRRRGPLLEIDLAYTSDRDPQPPSLGGNEAPIAGPITPTAIEHTGLRL